MLIDFFTFVFAMALNLTLLSKGSSDESKGVYTGVSNGLIHDGRKRWSAHIQSHQSVLANNGTNIEAFNVSSFFHFLLFYRGLLSHFHGALIAVDF